MERIASMTGAEWAYFGAALAAIGGGIGSAIGITSISNAAAGVVSEDPNKFGKVLPLAAMPGTQGIYGLVTMVLVFVFAGVFSGEAAQLTADEGLAVFFSCLPVAFVCMFSGIYQGTATGLAEERRAVVENFESPDVREGVDAFLAGRKPQFRG